MGFGQSLPGQRPLFFSAYLVAVISEKETRFEIFSEANPTILGDTRTAVICSSEGSSYSSARGRLVAHVKRSMPAWLLARIDGLEPEFPGRGFGRLA
jgi:hypothetical protein